MRHFKLVIIGAGTAGLAARTEALRYTDSVLLINAGPYGTTCARVGCMPSKALLAVAHNYQKRAFMASAGIHGTEHMQVNLPEVMQHVRTLRDGFTRGSIEASKPGPHSIAGNPVFLDAQTLEINGERITTDATIIATGTRPVMPASWQALGDKIVTSDTFFELENPGQRVGIVGLGPIGIELGQALAQLGCKVYGFSHGPFVAGISSPDINATCIEQLTRTMEIHLQQAVTLQNHDQGVRMIAGDTQRDVDWVLAAVGRTPNTDALDLAAAGITCNARGIPAFDPVTMQIGELPIFIAGDVAGTHPLMHEAADDGRIAAWHALHPQAHTYARRAPLAIVFAVPNVATAGCRYKDLPAQSFVVGKADFSHQGRAIMEGEGMGLLEIYADKQTGRLLGSEMAITGGEHIAHLLAWAIQQKQTVHDLLTMPIYHPVIAEGLRTALQNASRQLGPRQPGPNLPRANAT